MGLVDILLPYLPILLDVGNIIFFVSTFSQVITAYKKRQDLSAISNIKLLGFICSTVCFILAGLITGAPMTVILGSANEVIFALQLYWKRKYR